MKNSLLLAFFVSTSIAFAQSPFHTIKCGEPVNTFFGTISDTLGDDYCQLTFDGDQMPEVGVYGQISLYDKTEYMEISTGIGKLKIVEVNGNVVKAEIRAKSAQVILGGGKELNQFHRIGKTIKFEEYVYGFHATGEDFWENGNVKIRGPLRCNKRIGEWNTYYEDGTLESNFSYNDDSELTGLFTEYHPNGSTKSKGYYRKDKKYGLWSNYDENGELLEEGYYRDGEKTGKWIERNDKGKKVKVKYS